MSSGTEEYRRVAGAHPGRHRRGSADAWTPPVPPRKPVHRHRGEAGQAAPVDPPATGFLPLPQPRTREPQPPVYPAAHGTLPVPAAAPPDPPTRPATPPVSAEEQAARRTRVSLAQPKRPRPPEPEPDDEIRIFAAPLEDGLGTFDLGSVPASVTPPKTWRKAAWFATGASGAVVVGLLFAGTFLVGKPPVDQARQPAFEGLQGGTPLITEDPSAGTTGGHGGGADGHHHTPGARPDRPDRPVGQTAADPAVSPSDPSGASGQSGTGTGPSTTSTTPTSTEPPQKPPVVPAPRETPVKPPWWYSFPPDAQTMGDNTESFFNNVTTDPNEASTVTTGPLHDEGAQALRQRYAGVAYFVVKDISIDQERGVTVNTVEITREDGTKTIEHRTLTFGDGDKISGDGM